MNYLFLFSFFLLLTIPVPKLLAQQTRQPVYDTECQCTISPAITTTPTNAGTEFLLCFEENTNPNPVNSHREGYLGIYLASIGDTATVTITCKKYPALRRIFFLQSNGSVTYDISDDTLHETGGMIDTMRDLWINSDETNDETVVEVDATSPIVCYGLNEKPYSADAFCALPGEYAGTEYRILSYASSPGGVEGGPTSSEFVIAAFQNNTRVTITPTARTIQGNAKGTPEAFSLQQGECVQIQADTPNSTNGNAFLDLTGSIVTASHPVAVYAGHVMTEIPDKWVRYPDQYVDRDMLAETMPPTSAWGESFVLDAIDTGGGFGSDGDLVRVLALDDSTHVSTDGTLWTTLQHDQFQDDSIFGPMLITADKPLLVAEMEHSEYQYGGNGDPFLAIVPPMEQTYNSYSFFLPQDSLFRYQSLIVACDTTSQRSISIDNTLIPSSKFISVPGTARGRKFAVCEIPLSQGLHTITTNVQASQGFTILGYGVGAAISYGYAAGSLLVPKRSILIEYPPQVEPKNPDSIAFHNTAYQPAYLDSAIFVPIDPTDADEKIHVKENVAFEIGRMDIGASAALHLVHDAPIDRTVSGMLKIYSHLPSYFHMEPGELPVTIYPENAAVKNSQTSISATVSSNPFSEYTTIDLSMPESGDMRITVFDALGRQVREYSYMSAPAEKFSTEIDRGSLPSGVYICTIASSELNIHLRIPVVIE